MEIREIEDLIDSAFGTKLRKKIMEENQTVEEVGTVRVFESADAYRKETGKRFRMTKDQKSRGLDRNAAWAEFAANGYSHPVTQSVTEEVTSELVVESDEQVVG